jgi:GTP diphosphokinase / guanosine-3',5'-bis(diphosphate) 3'-diphosphatase
MLWTEKTERALNLAAILHDGQYRKGDKKLPVLTHIVAVASIAGMHTDDEDVITAALLHDLLEDTPYTYEEMSSDFSERVANIVRGVSIPEAVESDDHSWTADRTRYYENLKNAPVESAIVAAADKIHNFSTMITDYSTDKEKFKEDFGGSLADRARVYGAIVGVVIDRIPEGLANELAKVWSKYKVFVETD